MDEKRADNPDTQDKPGRLNTLQVLGSVFAAGLGVQSSKNRERDFKRGHIGAFIAAGIIMTLLLIGTVVAVVQTVLKNTGG